MRSGYCLTGALTETEPMPQVGRMIFILPVPGVSPPLVDKQHHGPVQHGLIGKRHDHPFPRTELLAHGRADNHAGHTRGWRELVILLFGQDQSVVAGDSEAIGHIVMKDDDFMQVAKEFAAGNSFLCHG